MIKFRDGFYADVRVETVFTTSIKYRDGALEESKNTTLKKRFCAYSTAICGIMRQHIS